MIKKIKNAAVWVATAALLLGAAAMPSGGIKEDSPGPTAPVIVLSESTLRAAEGWSDDQNRNGTPLLDVPLGAETQRAIFDECGQDTHLFCAVMAIAAVESGFDPQLAGDGGDSVGMMQINTRWHTGRMDALGVTDLEDPVQCAAVAIDYLLELKEITGAGVEDHQLYTSYNAGPSNRTTPTDYSKAALEIYWAYIAEMGDVA